MDNKLRISFFIRNRISMAGKKHIDKTSAETKSIGFDFQYYFFLWKLLSSKPGESVGLEVKDDVHTEMNNDVQIFYQIKHSIRKKADGSIINLTSLDLDLWKTLSNWSKVITDENDNRDLVENQLKFIEKSSFVIWTNKSLGIQNTVVSNVLDFQKGSIESSILKDSFENILTDDDDIKKYINNVISLEDKVFSKFCEKMLFNLGEDDIIGKCKDEIKAKMIPETQVEEVFKKIDSSIREDNFIDIKDGEKIEITFDQFKARYEKYFLLARTTILQVKDFDLILPDKLEDQIFIKQLVEINDVGLNDIELIAEYTRFKLKLLNNIENWYHKGEITREEIVQYREDAINQWKVRFRKAFRNPLPDDQVNIKGQEIIDSSREIKLMIANQILDTDLSNGEFYNLSDIPKIGWKEGWEKYQK